MLRFADALVDRTRDDRDVAVLGVRLASDLQNALENGGSSLDNIYPLVDALGVPARDLV